jgi:hypothetical protein
MPALEYSRSGNENQSQVIPFESELPIFFMPPILPKAFESWKSFLDAVQYWSDSELKVLSEGKVDFEFWTTFPF